MSVSIYYSARRAQPLTGAESAAVERVVAARAESFPYDDEEGLYLYGPGDDDGIIAGSTKLPGGDPGRWLPVTAHVLDSVTELRRAVGEHSGTSTWTTSTSHGTRPRATHCRACGTRHSPPNRAASATPRANRTGEGGRAAVVRPHRGGPSTSSALRGSVRGCWLSLWRSMEDRR